MGSRPQPMPEIAACGGRRIAVRSKCTMLNPVMKAESGKLVQVDRASSAAADANGPAKRLFGLDREALEQRMVDLGEPSWRGKQVAEALYCQRIEGLDEITTLRKQLRGKLADGGWEVGRPTIRQVFKSVDGTERYLVECGPADTVSAATVETVWMPEGDDGEAGDGS